MGQFDSGGWYSLRRNGDGVFLEESTLLRYPDWFEFRDPSGLWEKSYIALQAEESSAFARHLATLQSNGSFADMNPRWCQVVLGPFYEAYACFEWGCFVALSRCVRESLSDTLAMALVFAGIDRVRHQQTIAAASLALTQNVPVYADGLGPDTWANHPAMEPMRLIVERLLETDDWCEIVFVIAMLVDPLVANLFLSRFLRRFGPANGDMLTPVIVASAERDRSRFQASVSALMAMLLREDSVSGAPVPSSANRAVMNEWIRRWSKDAGRAVDALVPLFNLPTTRPDDGERAKAFVLAQCTNSLGALGLNCEELTTR
jgi:methane monooxygenase component A beta chain/propane monooxygenase small subunit